MQIGSYLKARLDSFVSLIANLNTGKDKAASFEFRAKERLDYYTLDFLYAQNPLVQKIVDLRADEMTKIPPEINHNDSAKILEFYTNCRNGFQRAVNKALKFRTLHGAGFIFIDFDDNTPTTEPLNLKNLKDVKIKKLTVADRWLVQPYPTYTPFEEPEYWQPVLFGKATNVVYHKSRVIRIDGIDAGERLRSINDGHGESFIDSIFESVRNVNITHNIIPTIITEFIQGIYKIKGINQALKTKNKAGVDEIKDRFEITSWAQSVVNKIVIDADDDYVKNSTNVTGLTDLIHTSERRLVADAKIPHSLLLGESPGASLGEAGASQKRDWYDFISSEQTNVLTPVFVQINEIIAAIIGISDVIPFKHVSLWKPTELEDAELRKIQAEIDVIYHSLGVDNQDIIESRFGQDKYSTGLIIKRPIQAVQRALVNIANKIKDPKAKNNKKEVA